MTPGAVDLAGSGDGRRRRRMVAIWIAVLVIGVAVAGWLVVAADAADSCGGG